MVSPLSKKSTVGTLEATGFGEIKDLIPFHVFLIFQFLQNIHHNKPVYFIRVDSKFLYFLLLVLNSSFSIECFLLMKFVSNLLFIDIDFCILKAIQSLDLHFNLRLLILFKGV